jgi:hypothetical protein
MKPQKLLYNYGATKQEIIMAKKKTSKKNLFPFKTILFLSILIAGGVFVYLNFGNWAKNLTEKIASDALGVRVQISSLHISLKDKEVRVNNLRIHNPRGYKTPHAMTTKQIKIGLNTASKELIDFKNIQVNGTTIYLEVTEKGNNLSDMKKLAAAKPQKKSIGSEQVRVIIKKMTIGASTLKPSITLLGGSLGSIDIPAISFSNIGKKDKGVLAKEAITQILTKYMSVAEKNAGTAGFLKGIGGNVEKTIKGTENQIKNIGKDFEKNIGGIFGN